MITAFKKVFCSPDSAVLTQLPMSQKVEKIILFTHIVVAFSLYFVQVHYNLLGVDTFREFSIWLLVTANSITCLFGSCRGFDRVTIFELFIGAFVSFYYHMYLNIPVIAVMLYQTWLRLEGSFEICLLEELEKTDSNDQQHKD